MNDTNRWGWVVVALALALTACGVELTPGAPEPQGNGQGGLVASKGCQSDAQCSAGQTCEVTCLHWCPQGDPSCCSGQCVTPPPPPADAGTPSCTKDSDCASGNTCEQICLHWCAFGDPTCCSGQCTPKPEIACAKSSDCPTGTTCDQLCLTWCPAGDPTCCSPGVCR